MNDKNVKVDPMAVGITSVSDAEQGLQPGVGIICEIHGSLSPPGSGWWNIQLFKIMNFSPTVDASDSDVIETVKTYGIDVQNVDIHGQQWSHYGLYGAKCDEENTVVVVIVWQQLAQPEQTNSYGRDHTPTCTASCGGSSSKQGPQGFSDGRFGRR